MKLIDMNQQNRSKGVQIVESVVDMAHRLNPVSYTHLTSFGKERVFDVVDKRLLTGKPMIVTTNIPLSVMKQAVDLDDRRDVYKRQVSLFVSFSRSR